MTPLVSKPGQPPRQKPAPLLQVGDAPPYEVLPVNSAAERCPVLLVCDHASNHIPAALQSLGLDKSRLGQHIAVDVGTAPVARLLSTALNAPGLLAGFSRLVVDANRFLSDVSAMPAVSDGVLVPGNQQLSAAEWGQRVEELYMPYHQAVDRQLAAFAEAGETPLVVFVHSFTPTFQRFERPWHVGVVWDADERSATAMMHALRQYADWQIGDNQPYSALEPMGYSMYAHAAQPGLPHVMLEIRQDLIESKTGQQLVANRLLPAIKAVLEANHA